MTSGAKKILLYLKQFIAYIQYKILLPDRIENSDLYLVAFPRSGITWLSTIIINTCLLEAGINMRATHFNIEQFIGDIHKNKRITKPYIFPFYRIIKSHSAYNPFYRHVIYLVRNPFNVMISYYHFTTANGVFNGNFEEFVQDKKFGAKRWAEHVMSWIEPERPLKFHLIRYEDLHNNTLQAINALYGNLGWTIDGEKIKKAIQMSNFQEMRQDNNHYKRHCPFRKYDFVREGKKEADLPEEIRRYITEAAWNILERVYPEY